MATQKEVMDRLWWQARWETVERENRELRDALVKALDVQAELCANRDMHWCREECSLYRSDTNDCAACDPIEVAYRLGALPKGLVASD